MITVSRKDVMGSAVIDNPGWHVVEVGKVSTKAAKTDQSTNFIFPLKFVEPSLADYRIKDLLINEKGIFGSGIRFLRACGLPDSEIEAIKKNEKESVEIDETRLEGKKIKAFIAITTFENRKSNEANDFLPLEGQ